MGAVGMNAQTVQNKEFSNINSQINSKMTKDGKEINSFSKCGKDELSMSSASKCMRFDPGIFEDAFGLPKVEQAKDLVKNILNCNDKASLVQNVRKFENLIQKMDKNDLLEVAGYLNKLMAGTDKNDELLGTLMQSVLDEVKERGSFDHFPKPLPFPGPKPFPMPGPCFPPTIPLNDKIYDYVDSEKNKINYGIKF